MRVIYQWQIEALKKEGDDCIKFHLKIRHLLWSIAHHVPLKNTVARDKHFIICYHGIVCTHTHINVTLYDDHGKCDPIVH